MHTIDIIYAVGISVLILGAIIFFGIAFSKEEAGHEGQPEQQQLETDEVDILESERPYISFNDQFN